MIDETPQTPRAVKGEDWQDYRHLVVTQLSTLGERIESMDRQNHIDHLNVLTELSRIRAEVSGLQVKASFYGAISGLGAGLMIFLAQIFGRHP